MISAFVLSSAFVANLKSSLINKSYEDNTANLDEMIDKDMLVHMDKASADYLGTQGDEIRLNDRLLCQAKKYDSIFRGYDNERTFSLDLMDLYNLTVYHTVHDC